MTLPKGLLDALDIVLEPVSLCDFLLANGHTGPCHAHDGNVVDIVLVKLDVEGRVMTGWPLVKAPFLDNFRRLLKLDVFS